MRMCEKDKYKEIERERKERERKRERERKGVRMTQSHRKPLSLSLSLLWANFFLESIKTNSDRRISSVEIGKIRTGIQRARPTASSRTLTKCSNKFWSRLYLSRSFNSTPFGPVIVLFHKKLCILNIPFPLLTCCHKQGVSINNRPDGKLGKEAINFFWRYCIICGGLTQGAVRW